MARVILGYWKDTVIDNRAVPKRVIQETFPGFEDFEEGNRHRAFIGWDGFFIFDREAPVVDMIRHYVQRIQKESCGYCTPCRVGTKIVGDKLSSIAAGFGREQDISDIRQLAEVIRDASMCELGHTSMNALLKIMELMPEAFEEAVRERRPVPRGAYHSILTAPCIEACPAHLDIPYYVDAIRSGNYNESLAIIGQKNPLPGICGRVCVRPCEFACRREELDDPISIKYLKRFVTDQIQSYAATRSKKMEPAPLTSDKKVAIIGSGPCGLTAAFFLRQKGYPVDVFEQLPEPGGMSAVGIPDYRLPRSIIAAEVSRIAETGVQFHYGVQVGRDKTMKELRAEFGALLIAIGAHGGKKVGITGEESKPLGLVSGVTFLKNVNLLLPKNEFVPPEGTSVVVIGGGNVAMDCARSARRLGYSTVRVVYRRTEHEMPADAEEIRDARDEGIEFHFLTHPIRLESASNRVTGLTCVRMELGEPDASGRQRPVEVKGSDFFLECDVVIPAIGQGTDFSMFGGDFLVKTTKWGTVEVDEETLMTSQEGVFSGGDCVSGPKALIDAMRQGLHAAHSIDLYLKGEKMCAPEGQRMFEMLKSMNLPQSPVNRTGNKPRSHPEMRPVNERTGDFNEVEAGYSPKEAIAEAERCLRCYRLAMFVTEE
ncbi:MAG TPA: FAD-dependent oxidoreductase [Syntrophorhabdales bacterium]|nr:FAD-dependent oxidoreductase [Syntrophorhabdales bacterium]